MINTLSPKNAALARATGLAIARGQRIGTILWITADGSTTQVDFDPPTAGQILVKVDGEPAFFPLQPEEQSMLYVLEMFSTFKGEIDLLCQFISASVRSCYQHLEQLLLQEEGSD